MKVLHVNNMDIIGNRFNGHDMQLELNKMNIDCKQVVMEKLGNSADTILLANSRFDGIIRNACMEFESKNSLHALLYPYLWKLMDMPEFKAADIVHYHLLHNYFGSLAVLPEVVKKKKSILTIHDPWIFSGHCIYSLGCDKWKSGCGDCPNLDLIFKMQQDNTKQMWNMKYQAFSQIGNNLDIVVASKYMYDLVKQSPITESLFKVHLIPFGIDLSLFTKSRDQDEIRARLAIPKDNYVITFRADASPYKGLKLIIEALKKLKPTKAVTLLTVGNKDMLSSLSSKYQIVDFGWITDDNLMAEIYCACDVFLMPSTAEAFGLMAIETMASSRPLIVCDGTSLPEVSFAPECGISIPQGDNQALAENIERLIKNPQEAEARGQIGRELAEKNYSFDLYIKRHIELYCGIDEGV